MHKLYQASGQNVAAHIAVKDAEKRKVRHELVYILRFLHNDAKADRPAS